MKEVMDQTAPFPQILNGLVNRCSYKVSEGWVMWLEDDCDRGQGSRGLTLIIQRCGPDSYHPERILPVNHLFPVPPAAYNERSWKWWLFQQLRHSVQNVRTSHGLGTSSRATASLCHEYR
jgi:hypothetical protein